MTLKGYIKKTSPQPLIDAGRSFIQFKTSAIANYRLRRIGKQNKEKTKKAKVGFIVQMPEIWDKEAPVFEEMLSDERCDAFLIVVPPYNLVRSQIDNYGMELAFFKQRYSESRIIQAYQDENWIELQHCGFDYIFFQRCYEHYLPKIYHASSVIKYAKTCYIPYCFHALDDDASYYRNAFFANLYLFFCCSEQQQKKQKPSKFKKCVFLGFPALTGIERSYHSDRTQTVLWTPRWTNDDAKEAGGSNFIKYMDSMMNLKDGNDNIQLVFRPHPLAFSNAIKTGIMSEEQVDEYKQKALDKGIVFDTNAYAEDTFKETDILVTDFSSIVIMYMLSGKPFIYCSSTDVRFSETYKRVIECAYVAKDFSEIEMHIKHLINGVDPLKEKRLELAKSLREKHRDAAKRIVDYIANEAKGGERK